MGEQARKIRLGLSVQMLKTNEYVAIMRKMVVKGDYREERAAGVMRAKVG